MPDWLQFSLLDMTPYDRLGWLWLIESYQQDYPNLPLVSLLYSAVLAFLVFRPFSQSPRLLLILLALSWLWCGLVFQMQYHASMNWAASYMGWVFIAQAGLLLLVAVLSNQEQFPRPLGLRNWPGLMILLLALLYPLMGLLEGRTTQQLEWPGLMSAPITWTTIGVLVLRRRPYYWLILLPIPVFWALLSAAFTWRLGLLEPYVTALALLVMIVVAVFDGGSTVLGRRGNQRGTDA